jgi:hypothetical protein
MRDYVLWNRCRQGAQRASGGGGGRQAEVRYFGEVDASGENMRRVVTTLKRCPHARRRNNSNSKLRFDHQENGAAKNPINKPVRVVSRTGSTSQTVTFQVAGGRNGTKTP